MNTMNLQGRQILERYPLERKFFDKIENISPCEVKVPHCCYCEEVTYVIANDEPLCRKHFLLKCLSLRNEGASPVVEMVVIA